MQWINSYISQFGGDPSKVTLYGLVIRHEELEMSETDMMSIVGATVLVLFLSVFTS